MTDVLSPAQRKLNMSRIHGKDTKPEMTLRRALYARGVRYRLHRRDLPGCPDIVFMSRKTAIFVHGCFWHGHSCSMFKMPSTRKEFWEEKIAQNQRRDNAAIQALAEQGWRVCIVWECSMRGPNKQSISELVNSIVDWLSAFENRRISFPSTSR
jgi:DNA mismatch endonuclease (patch repair protein)